MPKLTRTKRSQRSQRSQRSKRNIPKTKRSRTRRKIRQQRGGYSNNPYNPFEKDNYDSHYWMWVAEENARKDRNESVDLMPKQTWDLIKFVGYFAPSRARKWFHQEVAKGRQGATESEITKAAEEARVRAEATREKMEAAAKNIDIETERFTKYNNALIRAGLNPVTRDTFDEINKSVGPQIYY